MLGSGILIMGLDSPLQFMLPLLFATVCPSLRLSNTVRSKWVPNDFGRQRDMLHTGQSVYIMIRDSDC